MIFKEPVWLLLLIPAFVSLWLLKFPSPLMHRLRMLSTGLLILALCGPLIQLPSRRGTVVIVADRSASMPEDKDTRHQEITQLIQKNKKTRNRLEIVSFGEQATVEPITHGSTFQGFTGKVNPDASHLAEAIQTAVSLIPPHSPGRILLLTDGCRTGTDPSSAVFSAVSRQISIDYRLIERPGAMDLAISEVQSPSTVEPGEAFMMTVWVQSPVSQEVVYQLQRGRQVISEGSRRIPAGLSRLTFRDQAVEPGTLAYTVNLQGAGQDPILENNTAKILIGVRGRKPLLCLSSRPDSGFGNLLARSGLTIEIQTPVQMEFSLERLSSYQGMILEDVPANTIGTVGMENIAEWVTKTGTGLMMTGGKNAYGPGGYFKSPLEPIMPVSMELRREHRKLSLAIVVALDRSGSMGAPVGFGKTKMDLANLATVEVLDMLSPMDQFGVLAVDSSAHLIVELSDVSKAAAYRNRILQIESMGGGIFVYEALSHAAKMVLSAEPQTKHIILFADAADSEEPGQYRELLAECTNAGITVSVIGLGKPTDVDAALLEEIAALGQGRCFFTESPEELPRLFAQDTFVVARSSFLETPTPVEGLSSMLTVTGRQFDIPYTIGGYNLCYLREGATLCVVSKDEYQAPIAAAWQSGIGRTLCYTPQVDGPFTGDIVNWPDLGKFLSSLARWTAGEQGQLGDEMALTQQVQNGNCRIQLHLSPSRKKQLITKNPHVTTLYGYTGDTPLSQTREMNYEDPDTLTLELPLLGARTYLSTVEVPGLVPVTLPPVALPYSPEFQPANRQQAAELLAGIARSTGGKERIDVAEIWNDLPSKKQIFALAPYLIVLAIILFLLEIFQRRTGLLSTVKWDIAIARKVQSGLKHIRPVGLKALRQAKPSHLMSVEDKTLTAPTAADQPSGEDQQGLFDALSKAQHKARSRTKRQ